MSAESPTARILPALMATAPGWPRPVERPVHTLPPVMTISALWLQAETTARSNSRRGFMTEKDIGSAHDAQREACPHFCRRAVRRSGAVVSHDPARGRRRGHDGGRHG